ncbi:MAG: SDR family oxidoreductase, partial [Anaerolineae bacterium]
ALELGPHGINVNAICPGFIRTDMSLPAAPSEAVQARVARLAGKAMLRRVGEPEDIARSALFLASDESSFVTAQVLTVDGGRMDFLSHSG